jgi:carboxyl-terminal processing protease
MQIKHRLAAFALALVCFAGAHAEAEPRVALVIGNANYGGNSLQPLKNPISDAKLMAATLRKAGFKVIVMEDGGLREMRIAIGDFSAALVEAGHAATGLFFFAGYGVQSNGQSYLVPVGTKLRRTLDINAETIAIDSVLKQMDFAGNAVNIAIIDAGRSSPTVMLPRNVGRGLAEIQNTKPGVFVSYSTAPGTTALDGKGANSPYAMALASAILTPGEDINVVFQAVRRDVFLKTEQQQVTWDASTLMGPFYFLPPG